MSKFKLILMTTMVSFFIFSCQAVKNSGLKHYPSRKANSPVEIANKVWLEAAAAAGDVDQMDQRSLAALSLYLDSGKQFAFGLTVSHLTLGIERASYSTRTVKAFKLIQLDGHAKDWESWGKTLRTLNRGMIKHLYFTYYYSKLMVQKGLASNQSAPDGLSSELAKVFDDIRPILPAMINFQQKRSQKINLTEKEKRELTNVFVDWEHRSYLQPKLVEEAEKLKPLLRISLAHVPGKIIEALFFEPFLNLRTTLSLKCFASSRKLHTKNFLNPDHRVTQARAFYDELAKIKFDPDFRCFNDEYYESRFPNDFFYDTDQYAIDYMRFLMPGSDDESELGWLYHQWQKVEFKYQTSLPYPSIKINRFDRKRLDMDRDPIERNRAINRSYHVIGQELSRCMRLPTSIGNWYHFATWASKSAGDVISGAKFKKLTRMQEIQLKFVVNLDFVRSKDEQKKLFAITNNMIAMEMIPLGREFINTFCRRNRAIDFSAFGNKLPQRSKAEVYLYKAFHAYFRAISARDRNTKIELANLGSTYQVISEQERVDENISLAFAYNGIFKLDRSLYRRVSTEQGSLRVGIDGDFTISLVKDISSNYMDPDLIKIELPEYRAMNERLGIRNDMSGRLIFKGTASDNWGMLDQRLKFLTAFFRAHITLPQLRERPE